MSLLSIIFIASLTCMLKVVWFPNKVHLCLLVIHFAKTLSFSASCPTHSIIWKNFSGFCYVNFFLSIIPLGDCSKFNLSAIDSYGPLPPSLLLHYITEVFSYCGVLVSVFLPPKPFNVCHYPISFSLYHCLRYQQLTIGQPHAAQALLLY